VLKVQNKEKRGGEGGGGGGRGGGGGGGGGGVGGGGCDLHGQISLSAWGTFKKII